MEEAAMALVTLLDRVERMTRLLRSIGLESYDPEAIVTDFLTDLRHVADWADLDFEAISETSLMLYEAEIDELESELQSEAGEENDHDAP
jgi:hypothetical protein